MAIGTLALALVLPLVPAAVAAQAPPDSLAARLRRAEAAIAALQQQVAEQSQGGAKARSGAQLEFTGRVLVNGFGNSRRTNNVDNPQFVLADPGTPQRGIGMAMRETQLGLAVSVPEVLGGAFTGDVDVDFYGGQMASPGGRTFPLVRLRTARAMVRWSGANLLIGQEMPLVSGLNPVTVAAMGVPAFGTAGNLWLWLPQVRGGVERGERVRVGLQAAVLAPTSGDPAATFNTDNDIAERSQRPFLQARAFVRWAFEGGVASASEIGCGVHQGWLMPGTTQENSNAVACDARLPFDDWIELRGEAYSGQALAGLGGGGIGQNFTTFGDPLKSRGGWAQLNLRPFEGLRVGAACGGDHPGFGALRRRNDSCAGYVMLRPAGPLFVGAELRRIRTEYASGRYTNDHVTLAAGFEF
jgi:hypothetical protein